MLESLVFAGAAMAVAAAAWIGIWLYRRRVVAPLQQPQEVSFQDRIVASAWRMTPTMWLRLPEGTKKQLRESVTSAPGPRRH